MPEEKDTTRKKNIFLTDEKERDTTSSRRKTERERRDTPSGANQFSVYAQRDTDSVQVDWGVIAKDISDEVTKISDERQTKRDVFATTQRNTLDELSKVADLTNQSVNNFVIRGADFSKNAMATQYELMVKGKIKPREWQLFQQNVKDGYANLSTFAKGLDDKYKATMKRIKELNKEGNPTASEIEIAVNEMTFSLADLKNKQLITNPSTGEMLIVTLQDDGNGNMVIPDLKKNPELYQSLATLNNRTAFQLDRRDTGTLTTAAVAELGEKVISDISDYTVLGGGGKIIKTTDIKKVWPNGKYDVWLNDHVDVVAGKSDNLNNPDASQVLANTGVKFSLKDEPGTIQYRIDGNGTVEYMMTPEQVQKARDIVQYQIESKLIEKIEMTQGFAGQQYRSAGLTSAQIRANKVNDAYTPFETMVTGSSTDAESAMAVVQSSYNRVAELDEDMPLIVEPIAREFDESGLPTFSVYFENQADPFTTSRRDSNGNLKTPTQVIDELFERLNSLGASSSEVTNKTQSRAFGKGEGKGGVKATTKKERIFETLSNKLTPDLFYEKNNSDVVAKIEDIIRPYGFTVSDADSFAAFDGITIKSLSGVGDPKTFNTDQDTKDKSVNEVKTLISYIKNNITNNAIKDFKIEKSSTNTGGNPR